MSKRPFNFRKKLYSKFSTSSEDIYFHLKDYVSAEEFELDDEGDDDETAAYAVDSDTSSAEDEIEALGFSHQAPLWPKLELPQNFIDLLLFLVKKKTFDGHREKHNLQPFIFKHHYVFTGKKGVGKKSMARVLHYFLNQDGVVDEFREQDAIGLLDTTSGFSPKIEDFIDRNSDHLIYFSNAEAFNMKGAIGALTGIEILANKLSSSPDVVVVLGGGEKAMEEVVSTSELARNFFDMVFHFPDLTPELLLKIAHCKLWDQGYVMASDAEEKLQEYLSYYYNMRGPNYQNIDFLSQVIEYKILPSHISHVVKRERLSTKDMEDVGAFYTIAKIDIPPVEQFNEQKAIQKLNDLIGLKEIKKSILNHTSLVKLNALRAKKGFYNAMPPMHMVFTGNPGTGKTTIAKYLGEIYRSIGALSIGHLVETNRSKLVGQYIGETEKNTLNAISRARGGVLFIDEAYNLNVQSRDNNDFGHRVLETLLTYLSEDSADMIVILAGYTQEMAQMLSSNPGLQSRFPYMFHFEDYTPDQLMRIGDKVLEKEHYTLTTQAKVALTKFVIEAYNNKDEHFGNGRFITRLLSSHIIPAVSHRLLGLDSESLSISMLSTIEESDIPNHNHMLLEANPMDATILQKALEELDQLVGLTYAKRALHNFVVISKMQHERGDLDLKNYDFYWYFLGKTGTGKSTVAKLLAQLLQGLGILKRGHFVSINSDEFIPNANFELLEKALKRADEGLLFIDMDSPQNKGKSFNFVRKWVENKVKEMKLHLGVVFAETGESNERLAKDLAQNGINTFNHSVVFDDFTTEELYAIFKFLLSHTYHFNLEESAACELKHYIQSLCENTEKKEVINARTMQLLAQAVQKVALLRLAQAEGSMVYQGGEGELDTQRVIFADVEHLKWRDDLGLRKVGF